MTRQAHTVYLKMNWTLKPKNWKHAKSHFKELQSPRDFGPRKILQVTLEAWQEFLLFFSVSFMTFLQVESLNFLLAAACAGLSLNIVSIFLTYFDALWRFAWASLKLLVTIFFVFTSVFGYQHILLSGFCKFEIEIRSMSLSTEGGFR